LSAKRGMESSSRIEIEKFNGKNFELWKLKMEDLLVDKEQWIVVDPGTALSDSTSSTEVKTLKKKVMFTWNLIFIISNFTIHYTIYRMFLGIP
jgi:hypothetical protein